MDSASCSFDEEFWDFKFPEDFDPNVSFGEFVPTDDNSLNLPNIPLFEDAEDPSTSVSRFHILIRF